MSAFKKTKVEENIWHWSPTSLKVIVGRKGPTIPLPIGYVPRRRGGAVVFDGPGLDALLSARRERDSLLRSRRFGPQPVLEDAAELARRTTLAEAFELVKKRTVDRGRQSHTLRFYVGQWPAIGAAFGSWPLASIQVSHLDNWLVAQLERVSPVTVAHYRQVLIRCFNVAARAGRYPYANPAALTDSVQIPEAGERRILADAEARALLEQAQAEKRNGRRWYSFFAVMLLTGLRFLECSQLRWEDFDWKAGILKPTHQKRGQHLFDITPELESVVRAWADPELVGYVFIGKKGKPVAYCSALRALRRLAEKAKILEPEELGLHSFRRTALTAFRADAEGDTMAFMKAARQSDLKVAGRYLPKVDPQARALVRRTAKRFGNIIPLPVQRKAS